MSILTRSKVTEIFCIADDEHVHTRKNNTGIDAARLQYLYPTQYDVGVDNNNFTPVSFEQVKKMIEKQVEQFYKK